MILGGQISTQFQPRLSYKKTSLTNRKEQNEQNNQHIATENELQIEQTCVVCCMDYPQDQFVGLSCNHVFCINCTISHLQAKIADRDISNIDCLQKCGLQFNPADIELICKNHKRLDIFDKYEYFRLSNDVQRDPLLTWCPKPNCGGFAKRTSKDVTQEHLKCLKCYYLFCGNCKAAAHNIGLCIVQHVEQFKHFVDKQNVRVCPQCQLKVQKNQGCNHMTCAVCKHEWCWKCGTPYYGYTGHDGQYCTEYIDADNFKINSLKFCCNITLLILLSPILLIPFMILTPFHLLGWYMKKLDDRTLCKCMNQCPGLIVLIIFLFSLLVFVVIFPILMLAAIPAMIYTIRQKFQKYRKITRGAKEYWKQFKKVSV